MPQDTLEQINTADQSTLDENPQLDIDVRPEPKPSNSSRKRKFSHPYWTRFTLKLKRRRFSPNLKLSGNASPGGSSQQSDASVGTVKKLSVKAPWIRKKTIATSDTINWCEYILRLKQLQLPDLHLSEESLAIINSFLTNVITKFQLCLRCLPQISELTVRELECATRLILPPELARHAVMNAERAVLEAESSSPGEFIQPSNASVESVEMRSPSVKPPSIRKKTFAPCDTFNSCKFILHLKKVLMPDLFLSEESLAIINSLLANVITKFHLYLRSLSPISELTVRELECATRMILPPKLAQRAVVAAERAVLEAESSAPVEFAVGRRIPRWWRHHRHPSKNQRVPDAVREDLEHHQADVPAYHF